MKVSDKNIREYLLKNELNKFFLTSGNSNFKVLKVEEFYGLIGILKNKYEYRITIKNKDKTQYFSYNTKDQNLFIIEVTKLSVDYMKNNLNDFIKLDSTIKRFFKERID